MFDDLHGVNSGELGGAVDITGDINTVLEAKPEVVKIEDLQSIVNTRFSGKTVGMERWDLKKGGEMVELSREVVENLRIVNRGETYGWDGKVSSGNLVGIIDARRMEMFTDSKHPDWMVLRWESEGSGNVHVRRYWSPDLDREAGVSFDY